MQFRHIFSDFLRFAAFFRIIDSLLKKTKWSNVEAMSDRGKKILIEFIVTTVLCTGAFLLVLLLRQKFTMTGFSDACFVACAPAILLPVLALIIRLGTFDVLNYGMYRLVESFRRGEGKRYDTAFDYKVARMEVRQRRPAIYWPFFVVGGVFLIAALVFLICYKCGL